MPALISTPTAKPLTSFRPFWAKRFGTAPFLPMSRAEMEALGWDSCDIIIVTGDAYVDHPSFGMAVIGRTLEAQGFRVGIVAQPDWQSAEPFKALGPPNLFYGVTAGNMDSMINRYTADRKIRSDDAYTPGNVAGMRPDRASLVYVNRCKEAYPEVPIVLGGIEASLRRIAHYDYWQDKVRRSILVDAKADLLLYGNAERAVIEIAHRLAAREPITQLTDIRGTAFMRRDEDASALGWMEIDSTDVDRPGRIDEHISPYVISADVADAKNSVRAEVSKPGAGPFDTSGRTEGVAGRTEGVDSGRTEVVITMPVSRKTGAIVMPPRERTVVRFQVMSRSSAMPCSTRMRAACCTSKPTLATRARWCSATVIVIFG